MVTKGTLLVCMLGLLLAGCTAQPASPAAASTATLASTEIPPTLPAATATPITAATTTPTAQDSSTARNQDRGLRFIPLYEVRDEKYSIYFPIM